VKHILTECVDFNDVRNKHFVASAIKDLFYNVEDRTSLILSQKLVFISNFNVFILMFVIYFLFYLNSLDLTFMGFTFLLIIFIYN